MTLPGGIGGEWLRRATAFTYEIRSGDDRASPVLLLVSLTVLLALGRPVILGQQRGGLNGKPFTMRKFRTMLLDRRRPGPDANYRAPERRRTHKSPDDPGTPASVA